MKTLKELHRELLAKNSPQTLSHPHEISVPEKKLVTVFNLTEEQDQGIEKMIAIINERNKKLPKVLKDFKDSFIFGTEAEKEAWPAVKKVYNSAILGCIESIRDAYGFTSDVGLSKYLKELLEKNMIEE